MGNDEEALEAAKKSVDLNAESVDGQRTLAQLYESQGDTEKAMQATERLQVLIAASKAQ
jgi:tetratricopeptide (TPR) repeat protein